MSLPQRKYREIVFQLLYSLELSPNHLKNTDLLLECLSDELKISKSHLSKALETAKQIYAEREQLDALLSNVVINYSFDRVQIVEKNILRLALYEMKLSVPTPGSVAISEAIRLAKKFGNPESSSFINALLDKLMQGKEEGHADTQ